MILTPSRAAQVIAVALIATVVTQVLYVALDVNGDPAIAWPIWRIEALAMTLVAALAFALHARHPLVAGGLVVGGLLNAVQTGMGLWMFSALFDGGEVIQPVAGAVLALSFFLYHAAKVALAVAAIAGGTGLWRKARGPLRTFAIVVVLAGAAALVTNAYAMSFGMAATFIAGAAGTVSTLLLAAILVPLVRNEVR